MEIDFANWITLRFMANTLLLGALRNEQLERFRKGGLKSIEWKREHRDENGFLCPTATATYKRVKPRNAADPNRPDEDFTLTIVCTCKGGHKRLEAELDQKGRRNNRMSLGTRLAGMEILSISLNIWKTLRKSCFKNTMSNKRNSELKM